MDCHFTIFTKVVNDTCFLKLSRNNIAEKLVKMALKTDMHQATNKILTKYNKTDPEHIKTPIPLLQMPPAFPVILKREKRILPPNPCQFGLKIPKIIAEKTIPPQSLLPIHFPCYNTKMLLSLFIIPVHRQGFFPQPLQDTSCVF